MYDKIHYNKKKKKIKRIKKKREEVILKKKGKRAGLYVDGRDAVKGQMLLMKEDRTAKMILST